MSKEEETTELSTKKALSIADVSARLYSLALNETLHADMKWGVRIDITRVPGGWIYQPICRHHNGKDEYYAPCFVPFNNEFQNVR